MLGGLGFCLQLIILFTERLIDSNTAKSYL